MHSSLPITNADCRHRSAAVAGFHTVLLSYLHHYSRSSANGSYQPVAGAGVASSRVKRYPSGMGIRCKAS
jgi:hypothetical protein